MDTWHVCVEESAPEETKGEYLPAQQDLLNYTLFAPGKYMRVNESYKMRITQKFYSAQEK